jgi:hypothetical protein
VDLVDGDHGELTVQMNGRTVAQKKDDSMPTPGEVLAAVRKQEAAGAR